MLAGQVYLVAGDESFLRDKAIQKIRFDLSKEVTPLIFYSDDTSIKEAVDACRSMDMLTENLVVIYKGFEDISTQDKDILSKYIRKPNPAACLIIEASARYINGKKPYNKLPKFKVLECNRPRIGQLGNWINKITEDKEKKIESQAVESLISKCGNSLKGISDAIEKLSLYVGESKIITLGHVQELIGFDAEYTAYNLIDEIFKKDIGESLRIANRVISKEKDIFGLMGLISFQLTRIYKAKNLLQKKVPRQEVLRELGIYSYLADKFLKQVERSNSKTINKAISLLAETDLNFKTRPGDYRNNFDSLIVRLCALK